MRTISCSGHSLSTSFERHTEPVPDPTSNRGVEIALMPAFGKEETTYIYDSSLIDFQDTVLGAIK